MKVSIESFLRTGKFGSVEIGMPKEQVLRILGEADCDHDLGSTGSILLYAWYEFFFNHESILYSIQNDSYDSSNKDTFYFKNDIFEIEPFLLNGDGNKNMETVKILLQKNSLKYKIIDYHERKALKLSSGIVVDFGEDENGEFEFIGIRFWPE